MKTIARLNIAALALLVAAGCGSADKDVSYKEIKSDLTPELKGLYQRPVDIDRSRAVAWNQDLRMMSDDIGRAIYWDHPSRLSPFPVLMTSGSPR